MTTENYRFYSFVAGLYISPLQCGLQTAHAVAEMSGQANEMFDDWAAEDKTIIICNALNSRGVLDTHAKLLEFGKPLGLPVAVFHEDVYSLNGAATATAVVVPERLYAAQLKQVMDLSGNITEFYEYVHPELPGTTYTYGMDSVTGQFIAVLKSYRLV